MCVGENYVPLEIVALNYSTSKATARNRTFAMAMNNKLVYNVTESAQFPWGVYVSSGGATTNNTQEFRELLLPSS